MKGSLSEAVQRKALPDAVAGLIERMILQGVIRPGEKLASERDLALRLDVSRPTLRGAIGQLTSRGLLTGGRGGTRVAPFLAPLTAPLAELFKDKPRVTADYFEYRRGIEAMAARLAATRASEADAGNLKAVVARMKAAYKAGDWPEEAKTDVDFHLALYEASHNLVLLQVMRAFATLLRDGVFFNREVLHRRDGARARLLAEHLAIAEAVLAGKAAAAEEAAAEHMRSTYAQIIEIERDAERLADSVRRLDRADFIAAAEPRKRKARA